MGYGLKEFLEENDIHGIDENTPMTDDRLLSSVALRELIYSWENTRFLWYTPQYKQHIFHTNPSMIRIFSGGNQTGKTIAGCLEFIWHVTGIYPPWYPEANKMQQPIKARIVVSDFTKTGGQVVLAKLAEWFPYWHDDSVLFKRKAHQTIYTEFTYLPNGSTFDIMSHNANTKTYEGWTGNLVWADEPLPRDKFVPLMRGLGINEGKFIMTQTPVALSESVWIQSELFEKSNLGKLPDGKVFYVVVDITENKYLTPEFIEDFTSRMTKEEQEARLHGRAIHLASLVYPQIAYDKGGYIVRPFDIPAEWTRYMAIDPHPRAPIAAIYIAIAPDGTRYMYDEIYLQGVTAREYADEIKRRENSPLHGFTQPDIRIIDGAGCVEDQKTGASWQSLFADEDLYFKPCVRFPGCVKSRIALCEGQLEVIERSTFKVVGVKPVSVERPNIYIFSHLEDFLYSCQNHVFMDYHGRKRDQMAPSFREAEIWSHLPDCWGMIELDRPYFKKRLGKLKGFFSRISRRKRI